MRTLETERLILRDWRENDLHDMYAFLSNPNVTIPDGSSPCQSLSECKRVLDYLIEKKQNYAIELKENGKAIGNISLNRDAKGNDFARNLGYCLAEEYWHRGIMTEALRAVIAEAKNITKFLSATQNNNAKSEHLLKKFGFREVGAIRNVKRKFDAEYHDEPYYILILED
ncbi:MAG: GNAT family N-acetyltransferase [Ruminococcaceae bacterium]|nr:GNAT family N-acetyltransferase [Oscillospiraceae bacterium]